MNQAREDDLLCPACKTNLRESIASGLKRCPECGRRFRLTELGAQPHWRNGCDLNCPGCEYDLRGTIASGLKRCPECGRRFRLSELPAKPPDELRISGRWLLLLALALLILILWVLFVAR